MPQQLEPGGTSDPVVQDDDPHRHTLRHADPSADRKWQARNVAIGGAIALLSAVIGVGGSLWAANLNNHAFDRRTQRDFLHSQRVAAFTKFLGDEESASKNETDVDLALSPKQLVNGYVGPSIPSLADNARVLDTDAASIRLVADKSAFDAATLVIEDHRRIVLYLVGLATCRTANPPAGQVAPLCPPDDRYTVPSAALERDLAALVGSARARSIDKATAQHHD